MILVGGEPLVTGNAGGETENLVWKLLEHPVLVASGNAFKETKIQTIKPPQPSGNEDFDLRTVAGGVIGLESSSDPKYVYILQKEFATVSPLFAEFIGTDEITTCLGLTIRDPSSGLTSVGHFDTADCVLHGVSELVNSVVSLSSDTFQVHLVGAFVDQAGAIRLNSGGGEELTEDNARRRSGWSWPLATKMIEALQNSMHNFEVETSSGRLIPAEFQPASRGPDGTVRGVCATALSADPKWAASLVSPYDTLSDTFKISPCTWGADVTRYALYMLTLPDASFLEGFSTSPYAEGPDFLPTSRRIFNYIKNFPYWEHTFPHQQPRVFTRTNTGGWVRKQSSD